MTTPLANPPAYSSVWGCPKCGSPREPLIQYVAPGLAGATPEQLSATCCTCGYVYYMGVLSSATQGQAPAAAGKVV